MLSLRSMQRGITMIEVMVSVAIVAIALAIGIPSLSTWLQNSQVKTTAESLLTGLQLARAEAVRQNNLAQFTLTGNAAGTPEWKIVTASSSVPGSFAATDGATQIQVATASEMGANARIGVNSASWWAATGCCTTSIAAGTGTGSNPNVVFDAFGRATGITRIDVTSTADAGSPANEVAYRRRVILISPSGTSRLCRPSLASSNPQGCP